MKVYSITLKDKKKSKFIRLVDSTWIIHKHPRELMVCVLEITASVKRKNIVINTLSQQSNYLYFYKRKSG